MTTTGSASPGEAVPNTPSPSDHRARAPAAASPGSEVSALRLLRARGPWRGVLALLGPAFVAAVAYVDPGNFATNTSAGAKFGYTLIWVIVAANLMAMLVQYVSAKVGVATGRDLPELCREHFPRRASLLLWVQAELVAMATDLAEFVGAAVGLNLVFGIPLFPAGLITAVVAFAILALEQRGYRRFELAILALLGLVLLGFLYDLFNLGADAGGVAAGLIPHFTGGESALLAAGIVGATLMPHVVYLHSALTKARVSCRDDTERRELLGFTRLDVIVGLSVAGLINVSMLVLAASLFSQTGSDGDPIQAAYTGLGRVVGGSAALAFGVALLASGLSSSSVGTYAGQVVMQGFLRRRIRLFVRRAVTMLPALIVLALGLPATDSLVISQVVLSFGIPFALVPLVMLTRRRDVMGAFTNRPATTRALVAITTVVIVLNSYLIYQLFAS